MPVVPKCLDLASMVLAVVMLQVALAVVKAVGVYRLSEEELARAMLVLPAVIRGKLIFF